jgi:hypothetical protein
MMKMKRVARNVNGVSKILPKSNDLEAIVTSASQITADIGYGGEVLLRMPKRESGYFQRLRGNDDKKTLSHGTHDAKKEQSRTNAANSMLTTPFVQGDVSDCYQLTISSNPEKLSIPPGVASIGVRPYGASRVMVPALGS